MTMTAPPTGSTTWIDVTVEATCPCGSEIQHLLTLVSRVDCPRCSGTFAVTALRYAHVPGQPPNVDVAIGYVAAPYAGRRTR